jgi:endoglucanase
MHGTVILLLRALAVAAIAVLLVAGPLLSDARARPARSVSATACALPGSGARTRATKRHRRKLARLRKTLRREEAEIATGRSPVALARTGNATLRRSIRMAKVSIAELERTLACATRESLPRGTRAAHALATAAVEGQPRSASPALASGGSGLPLDSQAPAVLLPIEEVETPSAVSTGTPKSTESKAPIEVAAPTETPELSEADAPTQTNTPAETNTPAKTDVPLSIAVQGNHLVNGSGQVVTLHGVNISGTEWQCLVGQAFYGPSSEASIAAIAAWHVNAVRIPLNEDCWLGINGAPADVSAYHEAILEYVDRLHRHGLYAILDLHWSAPGDTLSHLGPGFAGFYEMADAEHSPEFWESLASYFKEDHAVLFDLFNEPNGISWSCWLSGCEAPRGFLTAGMQQLVDAVRSTGATQPVMVGGLALANKLGSEWLAHRPIDPLGQLVASVHVYGWVRPVELNSNIGVVAAQVPVVAGEIGETNCADDDLETFLPWADEHDVSYMAWAWFVGGCSSYPSLISNYSGTPTNYGIGYRNHLVATFPEPVPQGQA